MKSRSDFLQALTDFRLTHASRSIALLWYYRQTQEYEERTASELANDLQEEGYPKPHVTRLYDQLRRSKYTVRGRRSKTFQIDARRLGGLEERYGEILNIRKVDVEDSILPSNWFAGVRVYLERLVHQINGCYQYGFYDACAVLCRRLMESLIIDIYIYNRKHRDIQQNGVFLPLESLISFIRADNNVTLGRNSPKIMAEIKQLGDTAAHDRVYITEQIDIDDIKARYRRLINDLATQAGVKN